MNFWDLVNLLAILVFLHVFFHSICWIQRVCCNEEEILITDLLNHEIWHQKMVPKQNKLKKINFLTEKYHDSSTSRLVSLFKMVLYIFINILQLVDPCGGISILQNFCCPKTYIAHSGQNNQKFPKSVSGCVFGVISHNISKSVNFMTLNIRAA